MAPAVANVITNRVDVMDIPQKVLEGTPPISNKGGSHSLREVEKDCIISALEKTGGNRVQAADLLGMDVATLYRRLKE